MSKPNGCKLHAVMSCPSCYPAHLRRANQKRARAAVVGKKMTGRRISAKGKMLVNRFAIVLDRSGSMAGLRHEAVGAFNRNVETIRQASSREGQRSTVTLVTFGDSVRTELHAIDVGTLGLLTVGGYNPDGYTPLNDALGETIRMLTELPVDQQNEDVTYLVMVITDGQENSSATWTSHGVKERVKALQATDRWTFVALVPPGLEQSMTDVLGFHAGNVCAWEQTASGLANVTRLSSQGTMSYVANRSIGVTSTCDYFTTDMSKVTPADLKRLLDLTARVRVMKVERECTIRGFVEDRGFHYTRGRAYYQLTKDETVQPRKEILIMEKGKKKVYGGPEARRLLGIPNIHGDIEVRPGNHANYDIFVQSTSVNRKLVRGTNLVYLKS